MASWNPLLLRIPSSLPPPPRQAPTATGVGLLLAPPWARPLPRGLCLTSKPGLSSSHRCSGLLGPSAGGASLALSAENERKSQRYVDGV
ncbi:hypothetical protein E2562_028285 [Oryza meyeriana var. granulata]|uniref:Uncharacterized protein n=1 Tax=Oryza meyeriana var. granulata TaxID=110450 RepID=A0A6G1E1T0_9ORYZ|nr:hypothetical protein E2562_028285 [Oryza meyeriana var. granulata]